MQHISDTTLRAYYDHQLELPLRTRAREHLRICTQCFNRLRAIRAADRANQEVSRPAAAAADSRH